MVVPSNPRELEILLAFLRHHCHAVLTDHAHVFGWVSEDNVVIAVGIDGWLGKTAQIHVAFAEGWHYPPREMLRAVFKHCFDHCKLEMLLGVVNSNNERAMRFDRHLGFRVLHTLPGMHDDGGDILLLGMHRKECRYLKENVLADVYA